jgi:hypothetical protein
MTTDPAGSSALYVLWDALFVEEPLDPDLLVPVAVPVSFVFGAVAVLRLRSVVLASVSLASLSVSFALVGAGVS